jgi:hypothetical protein
MFLSSKSGKITEMMGGRHFLMWLCVGVFILVLSSVFPLVWFSVLGAVGERLSNCRMILSLLPVRVLMKNKRLSLRYG